MKSQVASKALTILRKRADEVASKLKLLSHPQRLLILCSLAEGEKSVSEIVLACGASQSAASQFLKAMKLEGLIQSRRDGQKVFYRVADERLLELMKALYSIYCK